MNTVRALAAVASLVILVLFGMPGVDVVEGRSRPPRLAPLASVQGPGGGEIVAIIDRYLPESWGLLRGALSIPNDGHSAEQVEANLLWVEEMFLARGFEASRLETAGAPLLLAERTVAAPSRTVLIYLQIDGQPVDPPRWDQESPYEPVLKRRTGEGWERIPWDRLTAPTDAGAPPDGVDPEWRVFARSASDAKGPVVMFLTALDAMYREDLSQTFDLKVVMDFEEELGSPNLPDAVDRHREALAADMLLIFDGPRHASNRPTLTFGARGIVDVTMTVFGPRVPQHSGHYGNYVPNPAVRLAQLIASMKDVDGRVTIPGYYDGVEIDEATRAMLARTPDDESAIQAQLGIAEPDGVAQTYQEALQYPSLNIRGMASAWVGDQARTIIPDRATAEIDLRLVPGTDADRLVGLIRDHISAQGYRLIDGPEPTDEERASYPRLVSFNHQVFYTAFRTPYEAEVGVWLRSALTRAFGEEPVQIRMSGGSIPISPFVNKLGLPAVTVPTVQRDNNQHSPNENLRVGNFVEGVWTMLAILTESFD